MDLRTLATGLRFPEGPIALDDGSVLVVEINAGNLTRVAPDGTKEVVAHLGGGPNGAAIGPDGKVYVCNNGGFVWHEVSDLLIPGEQPEDYIGGRIQRVDLDSGQVEDLYTEVDGNPLRGPNDLVFDAEGGFYFTDLGKSRPREVDKSGLYYARGDGSSVRQLAYGLNQANGVALSPDGSRLYVAETTTGRVWMWDIDSPGVFAAPANPVGQGTLLYSFDGYQLLDSMAVDGDGNVCVATLLTGAISVISPKGELLDQHVVPEPDPLVTNVCFGGEEHRTAFITSSGRGRLYRMTWPHPGLALQYER
jgi:gluconolactonase